MKNKYEKWTNEMILSEMKKMNQILSQRRELKQVEESQTKCINNITTKDFVVYWGSYGDRDRNDKPEYHFSFTIRHDGKDYDIYYEHGNPFYPWWPVFSDTIEDEWESNRAFEFIPPGFAEASENSYEYRGTVEEAVAQLKKYGFVNFQRSPHDDDMDELKAPDGL